jgi:Rod binding domain-containing protein
MIMRDDAFWVQAATRSHQTFKTRAVDLPSIRNRAAVRDDTQLQAACREMESLFIHFLLKEMRATVDVSGFISGGRSEDILTSMLDAELSRSIAAAGGMGLAPVLMDQLGARAAAQNDPVPAASSRSRK